MPFNTSVGFAPASSKQVSSSPLSFLANMVKGDFAPVTSSKRSFACFCSSVRAFSNLTVSPPATASTALVAAKCCFREAVVKRTLPSDGAGFGDFAGGESLGPPLAPTMASATRLAQPATPALSRGLPAPPADEAPSTEPPPTLWLAVVRVPLRVPVVLLSRTMSGMSTVSSPSEFSCSDCSARSSWKASSACNGVRLSHCRLKLTKRVKLSRNESRMVSVLVYCSVKVALTSPRMALVRLLPGNTTRGITLFLHKCGLP
mmetsp:Transcript_88808/g.256147  ORF Transcript_88808/g.256147 Transcript_88808/m.256147 type:complete len:260 (+) Transcript_88808:595-1374(+)